MNPYEHPRIGEALKAVAIEANNVYIHTVRGDVWRVWVEFNGQPSIELVEKIR